MDNAINWAYEFKVKQVLPLTDEEKAENKKRLEEIIDSWKKFELEHPELAKGMIC